MENNENNEKYEVQDYDARDIMDNLDEEMDLVEINSLLCKLELEIDLKKYPALNTFFYSLDKIQKEVKAIKEYVNGR
jgi:hypothetical protein